MLTKVYYFNWKFDKYEYIYNITKKPQTEPKSQGQSNKYCMGLHTKITLHEFWDHTWGTTFTSITSPKHSLCFTFDHGPVNQIPPQGRLSLHDLCSLGFLLEEHFLAGSSRPSDAEQ